MQENWIGKSRGLQFRFRLAEPRRSDRRGRGLHHPARHDLRRELRRDRAGSSARAGAGRGRSRSRRVHRRMPARRHQRRRDRDRREEGLRHRARGRSIRSIPTWRLPVYIANFVLMDYGTGAIFGVPGARPARLRFRDANIDLPIRRVVAASADDRVDADRRRGRERARHRGQLALPRRADDRAGDRPRSSAAPKTAAGARARPPGACATGACRASAIGARRSRSSIATNAARCRCRATSCRSCCPRMSTSTCPAIRSTAIRRWKHVDCPSCGGAARARDRHARHLRRFELVFHPLRQPADGPAVRPRRGRAMAAGRANISAGSSMRSCTCSTRASGPARCSSIGRIGMSPSRSRACSRRAW